MAFSDSSSPEITVLPEASGIRPHNLKVVDNKLFFHGGRKPKNRLLAEMGTKRLNLVERDFGEATDRTIEAYEAYKKAGLPVVNTFRKTTEGKVVMTDVTADGSRIYSKEVSRFEHGEVRKSDPMDNVFLELVNDEKVVQAIESEVERIATLAGKNGIFLAIDDPLDLVIHPDKTWSLLCLDLEGAKYDPDQKGNYLIERNLEHASVFGISLQRARLTLLHRNTNGVYIKNIFEERQ